jgi:pectate lyase
VNNFGKLYRSCGNCSSQYKRAVQISNVLAVSGKLLAGINSNYGDTAKLTNMYVLSPFKLVQVRREAEARFM